MFNNEIDIECWICMQCLKPFLIEPQYASTLFEHGCAHCGNHEFALHGLLLELSVC